MSFSSAQCRAARNLLNWTQGQLASNSKVAEKTIADFERGATRPQIRTLDRIGRALAEAGIEFLNGDAPGVRVRKKPYTSSS
jgi:transcriptional regulator with XRE-family HTH domain